MLLVYLTFFKKVVKVYKFKKNKTFYVLYPDGEIWHVSIKGGDIKKLTLVYFFKDDELYASDNKPAKLKTKTIARLLDEYSKMEQEDAEEFETEKKPVPKNNATKDVHNDTGVADQTEEDNSLKGVSIVPIDTYKYLVNYKNRVFYVSLRMPTDPYAGWIIDETIKGNDKRLPGVYETKDKAMFFIKDLANREDAEKRRSLDRKGGTLQKRFELNIMDRALIIFNGEVYTAQIIDRNWAADGVTFVFRTDTGFDVTLGEQSIDIVGRAIPGAVFNEGPIKRKFLDKYLLVEKEERKLSCSVSNTAINWALGQPNLNSGTTTDDIVGYFTRQYLHLCEVSLKKIVSPNAPFVYKFVLDYLMTHEIVIEYNPMTVGSFIPRTNNINLNASSLSRLSTSPDDIVTTVVHEVVHYKLWPVENKLRNFLIKNVLRIMEVDPNMIKSVYSVWLKKYGSKKYSEQWTTEQVRQFDLFRNLPFMYRYAFCHWLETPAVLISEYAVGREMPNAQIHKLCSTLLRTFRKQLER